jgi:hypothetical protein
MGISPIEIAPVALRNVKTRIPPRVRRLLGYVWRSAALGAKSTIQYLRGRKILWQYTAYFRNARQVYQRSEGATGETLVGPVTDFGLRILFPNERDSRIDLPDNYLEMIKRIHNDVASQFDRSRNCYFFPRLKLEAVPDRTEEIPAVRNQEVIVVQLKHSLDVDGLEDLCLPIIQELERKIYSSYAIVEKVYVYRTPVCRQIPRASWLWHYDNHPREILKVLVYLTDVDERNGPFEFLRSTQSSQPVIGSPLAPLYGNSRVGDRVIRQYLDNGYESCKVMGPRGTMIIFDNNIIHRGNLATDTHRDVLVLQVRPATFRARPCIDPRWTGSFTHEDFSPDPSKIAPRVRSNLGHLRY